MTPRLSKRTLAVNKRRQLEAKLQKRKEAADFRLELSKSEPDPKPLKGCTIRNSGCSQKKLSDFSML